MSCVIAAVPTDSPASVNVYDEQRYADMENENAELKRKLAMTATVLEKAQAQEPVKVEVPVADPALVEELNKVKVLKKGKICTVVRTIYAISQTSTCIMAHLFDGG